LPLGGVTAVTLVTFARSPTNGWYRLVPWSEIQKGLVVVNEIPHWFTKVASVMIASLRMSDS
jgi:hypothetical protein